MRGSVAAGFLGGVLFLTIMAVLGLLAIGGDGGQPVGWVLALGFPTLWAVPLWPAVGSLLGARSRRVHALGQCLSLANLAGVVASLGTFEGWFFVADPANRGGLIETLTAGNPFSVLAALLWLSAHALVVARATRADLWLLQWHAKSELQVLLRDEPNTRPGTVGKVEPRE